MSSVNAAASCFVIGPGDGGERDAVDGRDRLNFAHGRRHERFLGVAQRVDRHVAFRRSRCRSRAPSSSSSWRVTPLRQPADERGRAARAVEHEEHVRSGRFAQVAAGVGEDRLVRAVGLGVGERAHVLGVGDRLQARERAALVARPRDDHDVGRGRVGLELERDHEHGGRDRRAVEIRAARARR